MSHIRSAEELFFEYDSAKSLELPALPRNSNRKTNVISEVKEPNETE
jgi:hypothetical protein